MNRMPDDFPFIDVGDHARRSKNKSWKEETYRMFTILINFYQNNNLLNKPILADGEKAKDSTKVTIGDLNERGYAFYSSRAEDKWFNALERGTPPEKTTILEKGLQKVTEESAA